MAVKVYWDEYGYEYKWENNHAKKEEVLMRKRHYTTYQKVVRWLKSHTTRKKKGKK